MLTKNKIPFTWLDLEKDAQVERLLEQFEMEPADPVSLRQVMYGPAVKRMASAVGEDSMTVQFVHALPAE